MKDVVRRKIITSAISYIGLCLITIVVLASDLKGAFSVWIILLVVLQLLRDFFLYLGIDRDVEHDIFSFRGFLNDYRSGGITRLGCITIINRTIIFPLFLVLYIVLILLKQLDFLGLASVLELHPFVEYTFLAMVALTGFFTVFREHLDRKYHIQSVSRIRTNLFVTGTIAASLLGTYIVFFETAVLGNIAMPISIISGLLIFLVGILTLEESDDMTAL